MSPKSEFGFRKNDSKIKEVKARRDLVLLRRALNENFKIELMHIAHEKDNPEQSVKHQQMSITLARHGFRVLRVVSGCLALFLASASLDARAGSKTTEFTTPEPQNNSAASPAITAAEARLARISRNEDPLRWADAQMQKGKAYRETAPDAGFTKIDTPLREAINAFNDALSIYSKEENATKWARANFEIGLTFAALAKEHVFKTRLTYYREVWAAGQKLNSSLSQNDVSVERFGAFNGSGTLLMWLGAVENDVASRVYYRRAIDDHTSNLRLHVEKGAWPGSYDPYHFLAMTLLEAGKRDKSSRGDEQLRQAVRFWKSALPRVSKSENSTIWAVVREFNGDALFALGERTEGEESFAYFQQAIECYRDVLSVLEPDESFYIRSQAKLAGALLKESSFRPADTQDASLVEAASHYRDTITFGLKPYAQTLNSIESVIDGNEGLATVLERQAALVASPEKEKLQNERQAALEQARRWRETQNLEESEFGAGEPVSLENAAQAFQAALSVYSLDKTPKEWLDAQEQLGLALRGAGENGDAAKQKNRLQQAATAFAALADAQLNLNDHRQWAMAQYWRATALHSLGDRTNTPEARSAYVEAVHLYETVLPAFKESGMDEQSVWTEGNLLLAQKILAEYPPE